MGKFYLEKYPVVSARGNEYLVSVFPDSYSYRSVNVSIYVKTRGLFGRLRTKRIVNGHGLLTDAYNERKWRYDYVAIVKHAVNSYEEETYGIQEKRDMGFKQFENWNGRD